MRKPPFGMMARFKRSVGLQADDDLVFAIDVAGRMRGDGARNLRDVEHAFPALLDKELVQACPELLRTFGGRREERFVAVVGLVVLLDEVANVDLLLPETGLEAVPGRAIPFRGLRRVTRL